MAEMTIKQIADLVMVSKPTVQKIINELQIEPVRIEKNKYRIYAEEDVDRVIQRIRPEYDTEKPQIDTAKSKNDTENIINKPQGNIENLENDTDKPQNNTAKTQNAEEGLETKALYLVIDTLQKQIEDLQAEREKKNLQIEGLMKALDQAQQLNAADKKKLMALEDQLKTQDQKEPENEVVSDVAEEPIEADHGEDQTEIQSQEVEPVKKGFWRRFFRKGN